MWHNFRSIPILGHFPSEVTGKSIFALIHADDVNIVKQAHQQRKSFRDTNATTLLWSMTILSSNFPGFKNPENLYKRFLNIFDLNSPVLDRNYFDHIFLDVIFSARDGWKGGSLYAGIALAHI